MTPVLFVALGLLAAVNSQAGETEPAKPVLTDTDLTVSIKHAPPYVVLEDHKSPQGFSVDLMRAVAARMTPPRAVKFVLADTLEGHLSQINEGQAQLGIAATSITKERSGKFDFSVPFARGGLSIVATSKQRSLVDTIGAIFTADLLLSFLYLGLFVVICAHLFWFSEKGAKGVDDRYRQGIGESIWWTIVTMTTVGYGDIAPTRGLSRLVAVLIMVSGIAIFGVAIASISSAFTITKLASEIQSPDDLNRRMVAVVEGTTSAQWVTESGGRRLAVADISSALQAVVDGRADAVVHDQAQLQYALSQGWSSLRLLDVVFNTEDYAIVYPLGSPLRKSIDLALLQLKNEERSVYEELRTRWLGAQ